jgi:predicted KAP-like P-loop ATPase
VLGSGKTSLIGMAEDALSEEPEFLTVSFSPWRFEDYEDVKTALMASVIGVRSSSDVAAHKFCGRRTSSL